MFLIMYTDKLLTKKNSNYITISHEVFIIFKVIVIFLLGTSYILL
jgi:hypothetical protein